MNKTLFRELGFTDTETKVYLSLLSLGIGSVGKIAEQSGLYRKNVSDALRKLAEKGVITSVIENKKYLYQAKNPKNLLRFLEKKKHILEEKELLLQKELPTLTAQFQSVAPALEAEIYRGTEGIKTILRECLNYKEILFLGATGDVETRLPYFWPHYNKKREQKKSVWKLLLVHEARNRKITKSKHYQYKILPKMLSGPAVTYIYGDHVAHVLWLEKPVAFVMTHKVLAATYRNYFWFLWDSLPKK